MKLIMRSDDELRTRMPQQPAELPTSSPDASGGSVPTQKCGFHHWHGHELHESRRAILVRAGAIFGRQQ